MIPRVLLFTLTELKGGSTVSLKFGFGWFNFQMFLDTAAEVQQRSRVPGSTWACGKGAKPAARSKGLTARREGVGGLGPGGTSCCLFAFLYSIFHTKIKRVHARERERE